jgi:hypothetical protein
MKLIKGLFGLILIGVIAGFVLSLITPQLELSSADFNDLDEEEF